MHHFTEYYLLLFYIMEYYLLLFHSNMLLLLLFPYLIYRSPRSGSTRRSRSPIRQAGSKNSSSRRSSPTRHADSTEKSSIVHVIDDTETKNER